MSWDNRPRSAFGKLAAIRAGRGPALVLLHGVGLRAEAWNAQIDALQNEFTLIAPDMPGHGESTAFGHTPTLADYVDAIATALDGPVHVAGHSMGAMIAMDLAARHPDKVLSVTAANAIFERSQSAHSAVIARAAEIGHQGKPDPGPTLQRWFGNEETPQRDACEHWLREVSQPGYHAAYSVFASQNGPTRSILKNLNRPALFITGADEPNSTPEMSLAMAKIAPQSEAKIVDGAAHMMPMTHATEVIEAMRAFYERTR